MRIRTIKPTFFKSEDIGALTPFERLLFIGLWCLADGEGRLNDRPKRIKVEVFPYDDCDTDIMLHHLAEQGLIKRYHVGKEAFIQVITFRKHQRITGKEAETPSEIPEFIREIIGKQQGNNCEHIEKQDGNTVEAPGTTGRERKGKEGKGIDIPPASPVGSNPVVEKSESQERQAKPHPRNPAIDTLAELCGMTGALTTSDFPRLAKCIVTMRSSMPAIELPELAAEMRKRATHYRAHWPDMDLTPESLAKHWSKFEHSQAPIKKLSLSEQLAARDGIKK